MLKLKNKMEEYICDTDLTEKLEWNKYFSAFEIYDCDTFFHIENFFLS